jgi:hypothetical protein
MNRQTDGQAGRQAGRQTGRVANGQTDRKKGWHMRRQMSRQAGRQTDQRLNMNIMIDKGNMGRGRDANVSPWPLLSCTRIFHWLLSSFIHLCKKICEVYPNCVSVTKVLFQLSTLLFFYIFIYWFIYLFFNSSFSCLQDSEVLWLCTIAWTTKLSLPGSQF